jgi:hypothetical protein
MEPLFLARYQKLKVFQCNSCELAGREPLRFKIGGEVMFRESGWRAMEAEP